MILEVDHLSKEYATADGKTVALDKVSLRVRRGAFVAVMGSSGAGKTTLLNMIAGLDHPDSGSILFDGEEITRLPDRRSATLRRRKIGVICQFYNLVPELNVLENIILPTELDGREIDRTWLAEIVERIGLGGLKHAYPAFLSGGQQQRVSVARALFSKPALVLADEPTGNLDYENSAEVIRLLKFIREKYSSTILVATHSNQVAAEADRTVTLSCGKIISDRRRCDVSDC